MKYLRDKLAEVLTSYGMEDRCDYEEVLTELERAIAKYYFVPPTGWSHFGTHLDYDGPMEFSEHVDDGGMPLWERPLGGGEE